MHAQFLVAEASAECRGALQVCQALGHIPRVVMEISESDGSLFKGVLQFLTHGLHIEIRSICRRIRYYELVTRET